MSENRENSHELASIQSEIDHLKLKNTPFYTAKNRFRI